MLLKIFAIYDRKAGTYGQPFALQSRGVALRTLQSWVSDPASFFAKFPDDFELYEIGEFNQMDGSIVSMKPDFVGRAADVKVALAS